MMANPKLVRDRVEEGSLNPLEGMMSPMAKHVGPTPSSTPTAAAAPSRFSPFQTVHAAAAAVNTNSVSNNGNNNNGGGGDDGGGGTVDDDAWTSVFGPRSPLLVPPSAPLVPPPRNHPYASAAASSKESSKDKHGAAVTSADIAGTESSTGPESVTDALSAAMAKGLDLVSGAGGRNGGIAGAGASSAASSSSAAYGGGGGDSANAAAGVGGVLPGGYASGRDAHSITHSFIHTIFVCRLLTPRLYHLSPNNQYSTTG